MKTNTNTDEHNYPQLKAILDKRLGYNVPMKKVKKIGQMLLTLYDALDN